VWSDDARAVTKYRNRILAHAGRAKIVNHLDEWFRRRVNKLGEDGRQVLGRHLACPPCNIGPGSTPNYAKLASEAIHKIGSGHTVFAGQRLEGFYVDLGSIFDLGDLRPFQNLHIASMAAAHGVNATNDFSVHSIALKIPKHELTSGGSNRICPMFDRGVSASLTEKPVQPTSFRARTTYSTGQL